MEKKGGRVGGLVVGWSVGGAWGGVGVERCGAGYSWVSCPTYLITHSFAVVIAVSFHKASLAQRAIARGRTGGALAMSYAERRHTHED